MSQSEAATLVGTAVGRGTQAKTSLGQFFAKHTGCLYQNAAHDHALGYDINTLKGSIPATNYEDEVIALGVSHGEKALTISGHKGIEAKGAGTDQCSVYDGKAIITVLAAHAKAGAACAAAKLIVSRL